MTKWHVIASIGGGWAVRRQGSTRALKRFTHKRRAVAFARHRAALPATLYVHGRDGTVQWSEVRR